MSASPAHIDFGSFSDPAPLIADLFGALRTPPKIRVSDWAARTRVLNNIGGGYVGKWDNAVAPYLVEPMDEMLSRNYHTAAIVGPGQSAKTAAVENALLFHKVPNAPSKVLWYMQNDDAVEAYVKDRINALIEDHWVLSSRLGRRPVDDTLHYKRFNRMAMEFLAANRGNLINKSAPVIFGDEIDAYDPSLGDVWELLDIRRQTFGLANSMVIGASHPDRATGPDPDTDWVYGIMRWYRDSTRGRWYWPCPQCARFSSPNPGAKWTCDLVYRTEPDVPLEEVARSAHLLCPHNGCVIEDVSRGGMNRAGTWVHIGQDIETDGRVDGEKTRATGIIGWWIVGVMSPFIIGGIGALARKIAGAERLAALEGDEETAREVSAKALAIPRKAKTRHAPLDAKVIGNRADARAALGVVPDEVRFMTVAVDTQGERFVVQAEGWGVGLERWIIDRFDLLRPNLAAGARDRKLQPAVYPEDWDVLADALLDRAWPLAEDASRGMTPRLIAFDGYGLDGVTDNAYAFWFKLQARRAGHRMMVLKGEEGFSHPRVMVSYVEAERRDRYAGVRGEVPVLRMKVNPLKDSVSAGLRREQKGPRFINFPDGLPDSFYAEYAAEERTKAGWVNPKKARNESMDLSAYNLGLAYHLGADKFDWDRAPIWAMRASTNPNILSLTADVPQVAAPGLKNHGVKLPARPSRVNVVDALV